jgi:hypothetical protein
MEKRGNAPPGLMAVPVALRLVLTVCCAGLASGLAGCFGGEYAGDLAPEAPPAPPPVGRWTFEAGTDEVLPRDAGPAIRGQYRLTGFLGAEPNLGITADGTLFMSSYDDVIRWRPSERGWESVYEFEPAGQSGPPGGVDTADPMLWVDAVTDRVYASHMFPAIVCMALAWSDDVGERWATNEQSCTLPGLDHQKFFTAPPGPLAPPIAGMAYPTVAYQCFQRVAGTEPTGFLLSGFATFCNMSYDGGRTWPAETLSAARLPVASCGGVNGHPASAADGTVVVPITLGCDGLYVSVSTDSGLTWTVREGPKSVGAQSIDPDVSFAPDGTLHALWRGDDQLLYLARSGDLGQTWQGPWRVSPPHVTGTVFQVVAAGDDGRLAFAFLGTEDWDGDPSDAPDETVWHVYAGVTDDATASPPVVTVTRVTAENDPVQIGCVWLRGGGHPCRNMLDFIDAAVHPDGTFYVAFTKGCNEGCLSADDRSSMTAVAWLTGWGLHGDATADGGTAEAATADDATPPDAAAADATATDPATAPDARDGDFDAASPMVFNGGGW